MRPLVFGYDNFFREHDPMNNGYDAAVDAFQGDGVPGPVPMFTERPLSWFYQNVDSLRVESVADLYARKEPFVYELVTLGIAARFFGRPEFSDRISWRALHAIREGWACLMITSVFEGEPPTIFPDIHAMIDRLHIPASRVIFATSNLRIERKYVEWCAANRVADRMNVVATNYFLDIGPKQAQWWPNQYVTADEAFSNVDRPLHFLCFNRRPHTHRVTLASQLLRRGLTDRIALSFPSNKTLGYHAVPPTMHAIFPEIEDDVQKLAAAAPLVVDREDFLTNFADCHVREPYLRTYVSIVSETLFFNTSDIMFFSEKIAKPIFNYHPFILVGAAGSLRVLRDLGFRTFDGFIDESYDEIEDDGFRMRAILDEVERLANLPLSAMARGYLLMEDRLRHNAAHAMRLPCSLATLLNRCRAVLYES